MLLVSSVGSGSSVDSNKKNIGGATLIIVEDLKYLEMEYKIISLIIDYQKALMMDDVMATGTGTCLPRSNKHGRKRPHTKKYYDLHVIVLRSYISVSYTDKYGGIRTKMRSFTEFVTFDLGMVQKKIIIIIKIFFFLLAAPVKAKTSGKEVNNYKTTKNDLKFFLFSFRIRMKIFGYQIYFFCCPFIKK
jgi:hypothetical protein